MKRDEDEKLKENREYLREWIKRYKNAQDVLLYVQRNMDITEWTINALNERPDEAENIPLADLKDIFDRNYDHLKRSLPMMPDYDPDAVRNATILSSSGASKVYDYISRVGDLGTTWAVAYCKKYTTSYRELQTAQARSQAVRELLQKLNNPQTLERFDRALSAYSAVKSGTVERTAAALAMRNLIDGMKGDLFDKARSWRKENMTWDEMAKRLSKGQPGGTEYQELIDQRKTRTSLIKHLSAIAKDREGGPRTNLDYVWTQILDHIYTVLGLLDLDKSIQL